MWKEEYFGIVSEIESLFNRGSEMWHIRGGFTYEINNMQDSVSLLVLRITEFNGAHDFGFDLEFASFDMQWHAEHVKHAGTTAPVADLIFDDWNSGDDAIGILL